jgi:hypothetical protein
MYRLKQDHKSDRCRAEGFEIDLVVLLGPFGVVDAHGTRSYDFLLVSYEMRAGTWREREAPKKQTIAMYSDDFTKNFEEVA